MSRDNRAFEVAVSSAAVLGVSAVFYLMGDYHASIVSAAIGTIIALWAVWLSRP